METEAPAYGLWLLAIVNSAVTVRDGCPVRPPIIQFRSWVTWPTVSTGEPILNETSWLAMIPWI